MSTNPVATLGFVVPYPSQPSLERHYFSLVYFTEYHFLTFGVGEWQDENMGVVTFEPQYDKSVYFVVNKDLWDLLPSPPAPATFRPEFVTEQAWDENLDSSPSGFMSVLGSLMPKLFCPSDLLVDNGVRGALSGGSPVPVTDDYVEKAKTADNYPSADLNEKDLFNWYVTASPVPDFSDNIRKALALASSSTSSYITIKGKDDSDAADNTTELRLENGATYPIGYWTSQASGLASGTLVGGGAFCLVLNVVPLRPGKASPDTVRENSWELVIVFGEVTMTLQETGAFFVELNGNRVRTQLSQSQAKESPPQATQLKDVNPYVIVVYPVWNGIIVSNGIQDLQNTAEVSSVFVPKTEGIDISKAEYHENNYVFDSENPDEVVVVMPTAGAENGKAKVNFGTYVTAKGENCRFELAYVPLFFTHRCWFATFFIGSENVNVDDATACTSIIPEDLMYCFQYEYWPFYANNDAPGLTVNQATVGSWLTPNISPAQYKHIDWKVEMTLPARWGPEIYGYYLKTTEIRNQRVNNYSGNESGSDEGPGSPLIDFRIRWTGGTPGDSDAADRRVTSSGVHKMDSDGRGWVDWITNISTSVGLDGSSASITIDKYGLAGQDARIVQSIGAITIDIGNGPSGTEDGRIFSGIAQGISETEGSDGGTWTINIVGIEKKLDDIILVNAPYFDGTTVDYTTEYLCNYGGVDRDMSYVTSAVHDGSLRPRYLWERLPATTDIAAPMFDFKAGTTISDAISQTMKEVAYWYFIDRFGKMRFYDLYLGTDGFVTRSGLPRNITNETDAKTFWGYDNTKITSIDMSPEFEDIRNEIILIAMQDVRITSSKGVAEVPLNPIIAKAGQDTNPNFPWQRGLVEGLKGILTEAEIDDILTVRLADTYNYETSGKTQIPGNALIDPYMRWGGNEFVITTVSHTVDFNGKTWTTDLEFAHGF